VTKNIYIHALMDGRDTPPQSGAGFMKQLEAKLAELGVGQVASVCGRFWAMDRDNRWDRVAKAYWMLTGQKADATAPSASAAVQQYYAKPLTETQNGDEFVLPTWVVGADGKPVATIGDGDAVIFFNFRGDRPREISRAFCEDGFKEFERGKKLDLFFAGLTEYKKGLPIETILKKPAKMKNILGEWLSQHGKTQFRTAETEKYPHVTFFFNDYREEPFPGEERGMASSPKVATYDMAPDMSAAAVTVIAREALTSGKYDFVVVNFANPDMVGHTGSLPAAIRACEATDLGVGVLLDTVLKLDGHAIILADHGNAEQMWDVGQNCPHTSHTLNLVECFIAGQKITAQKTKLRSGGRLADVAPTVLALMGLPKPPEMTGESLIVGEAHPPLCPAHQSRPRRDRFARRLGGHDPRSRRHHLRRFARPRRASRRSSSNRTITPNWAGSAHLKPESVIGITGRWWPTAPGTENPRCPTGESRSTPPRWRSSTFPTRRRSRSTTPAATRSTRTCA
jgi:2,3-bisphosphoglycerate-independent phosphoglycerate mutase